MKFNYLLREDTLVRTITEVPNKGGHIEENDVTAHEAPHPEMDKAFENLIDCVTRICELASPQTIEPYYLTLSYTKHGTRSATIGYRRTLSATNKTYKYKTPSFKMDDPAQDEDLERQCTKDEAKLVEALINEGIRYVTGERQQRLLPLDDENAEPKGGKKTQGDLLDGDDDDDKE